MIEIKKGIVFSNDIKRILKGINALDYTYKGSVSDETIELLRKDFKKDVQKIFDQVVMVNEEEMLQINNLIRGDYPHCYA